MDEPQSLLFLIIGTLLGWSAQSVEYHLINLRLNWTDARSYCRLFHTDLASVPSAEDLLSLGTADMGTERAWIGVVDDPMSWTDVTQDNPNSWKYSVTDASIAYANWAPAEPDFADPEETCLILHSDGTWADHNCQDKLPAICFHRASRGPPIPLYFFYGAPLNWTDAQAFCRLNHVDLAWIPSLLRNPDATAVLTQPSAWIGAYRVPWRWPDNSPLTFTNWLSPPVKLRENQYCGVTNPDLTWEIEDCDQKLQFFCHGALKPLNSGKMLKASLEWRMQAAVDLSDPAVNDQILQQLVTRLKESTVFDVRLKWKVVPAKEEVEEPEEPDQTSMEECGTFFS